MPIRDRGDLVDRVQDAGRRLRVDDADDVGPLAAQRALDRRRDRRRVPTRRRYVRPSAPYRSSIWARRSPKYPVTTTIALQPGRVTLATAASIPDVPVPETAKLNDPSARRRSARAAGARRRGRPSGPDRGG